MNSQEYSLHDEFHYFIENQTRLFEQYGEKVLVITGSQVIGAYASPLDAYLDAQLKYPLGTFLIQRCAPGPEAYTVTLTPITFVP